MEQHTSETPLTAVMGETNTEKPVERQPELEKSKNLEILKLAEESTEVKPYCKIKENDKPQCSQTASVGASLDIEANLVEDCSEVVESEEDSTRVPKESVPDSYLENPKVPYELPQITAVQHIEVPLNFNNESVTETDENMETFEKSPKPVSEESSETTSDQLLNELELAPIESNDMEVSENVEDENLVDEGEENIESPEESPKIVSEESMDTTSDKFTEDLEISPTELIDSVERNPSLTKETEESNKGISEESSETTSNKLENEVEISPMELTEFNEENPLLSTDMNEESDQGLADKPSKTTLDKYDKQTENGSEDLKAFSNEESATTAEKVEDFRKESEIKGPQIQTNKSLKEESILFLQTLDSSKQESESLISNEKQSEVVALRTLDSFKNNSESVGKESLDSIKKVSEVDFNSSDSSKKDSKVVSLATLDSPTKDIEILDTVAPESSGSSKKVSELVFLETPDSSKKDSDSPIKETEVLAVVSTESSEVEGVVLLETLDSSKKESEVVALSTLISSKKEAEALIAETSIVTEKENEDLVLHSSDSTRVELQVNLDTENKEGTENSKLNVIEKATITEETLEPMDTYDSQESINLIIDETFTTTENKDESSEVAKKDEDSKMEVDQNDVNTETVKDKIESKKIVKPSEICPNLTSEEKSLEEPVTLTNKEREKVSYEQKENTKDIQEISKEFESKTKEKDLQTTEKSKEKISSAKGKHQDDLLNKSKDDDVIPVEQPPVPIIEIEDDDFEAEIPQTIIQEISTEAFMEMETNKVKYSCATANIEMIDPAQQKVMSIAKDSLLEIADEKPLEEALKSKEIEDLEDTSDEVFYNKECINYECPHKHKQFFKVPQFAFSFFKVTRKKFKVQYICADCYDKALEMYEDFCGLINAKQPLLMENIPTGRQEFVEIIDSSDDEDTNDKTKPTVSAKSAFSRNDLSLIEKELHNTIKCVLNRVEIQNQLTWSKTILIERMKRLEMETEYVDSELKSLQRKADKMHEGLYSCPKIKIRQLQPLDLNSGKAMAFDSHTQKEVQPIPPVGEIERPPIKLNSMYYAVKNNPIASWVPCKVIEQVEGSLAAQKNVKHYKIKYVKSQVQMPKNVPAKYLAYYDPPAVRLPIGTRVIAYFDATSLARGREKINVQSAFYPGIIAEPLKPNNKFRYLIFYDDGYTQYVYHKDVRLVCHVSDCVWEDVHPASRDFIQKYLTQYSINRPMVQTQKGQSMNTESNGYWLHARVVDIDCSLVLMQFEGSKSHTEWIYRGSLRLGPVFKEYQKTLQKNSNMPVSRLPRRTEPFIRYTEDEENSSQQQQQQTDKTNDSNRAVARKTFGRPESMMNSAQSSQQQQQPQTNVPAVKHLNNSTIYVEDENKPKGKVVYYTAKRNLPPRKYKPHKCSPSCLYEVTHNLSAYSPLSKPLLSGWERFVIRQKIKKVVTYRAPCGKVMRHMKELHHYLRVTNNVLNVDNFDFSHETNCLAEYVIESAIVQKRDISNGQEKMAIPLVNYYDNTLPPECKYSAKVIPTEGVHINTNPEFLIGCDCDDDCADKTKCACWQLTLTGAKYGNPNAAPEEIGYQYRRLLDHVPTGIYECNSNCKCKSSCLNRVVQNSLTMKLQVFKTSNRGWGLRCINDIPRGSFVCVYAGHLLTEAKANEGGQDAGDEYFAELDYIEVAEQIKEGYESEVEQADADEEEAYNPEGEDDEFTPTRSFLTRSKQKLNATKTTRIDEDSQERQVINFNPNADMNEDSVRENSIRKLYGKDEACYVMDAKISGNLGRYFNHSCAPNMFVQNVFVDTHDLRFPHVAFFSSSNIRAGTELTWNYNYEVGVVPGKVLYCQCGAANCRLRLL